MAKFIQHTPWRQYDSASITSDQWYGDWNTSVTYDIRTGAVTTDRDLALASSPEPAPPSSEVERLRQRVDDVCALARP